MNFRQDEEHQDILEMVHDFAVNEVKPLAAEIDRTEEFPMKNVKMMAEMGLMGIPFPEEYGGAGMDTLAYIQTVEECTNSVSIEKLSQRAAARFAQEVYDPRKRMEMIPYLVTSRNIC